MSRHSSRRQIEAVEKAEERIVGPKDNNGGAYSLIILGILALGIAFIVWWR